MNNRQYFIASGCVATQLLVGNVILYFGKMDGLGYWLMPCLTACCLAIHLWLFAKIPLVRCSWWQLAFIAIAVCYAIVLPGCIFGTMFWYGYNDPGILHDLRVFFGCSVFAALLGIAWFTPFFILPLCAIEWLWLLWFKRCR